jgi:predicted nucleotide-binding protein
VTLEYPSDWKFDDLEIKPQPALLDELTELAIRIATSSDQPKAILESFKLKFGEPSHSSSTHYAGIDFRTAVQNFSGSIVEFIDTYWGCLEFAASVGAKVPSDEQFSRLLAKHKIPYVVSRGRLSRPSAAPAAAPSIIAGVVGIGGPGGPGVVGIGGHGRPSVVGIAPGATSTSTSSNLPAKEPPVTKSAVSPDPSSVFIIHGRHPLRGELAHFIRSVGLNVIEMSDAKKETGMGTPYVGEIVDYALSRAQAVIALFTGDDLAQLRPELKGATEPDEAPTPQPRPNVIYEAGIAHGKAPERLIIVEVGNLRGLSDLHGRHVIRLKNTTECRQDLLDQLEVCGCSVKRSGRDWLSAGDFSRGP